MASGCQAVLVVQAQTAPDGAGQLRLELHLDQEAQTYLGLSGNADVQAVVRQRFPWVREADGWSAVTAGKDSAGT